MLANIKAIKVRVNTPVIIKVIKVKASMPATTRDNKVKGSMVRANTAKANKVKAKAMSKARASRR
jgi:hypothetical protein